MSITFQRQNSSYTKASSYLMSAPSNILMIPTDSLNVLFENDSYDSKITFTSSLSTTNSYSFSNIGSLITQQYEKKQKGLATDPDWVNKHPNWNKVMLVPVSITSTNNTQSNNVMVVLNEMGLQSTQLVGGSNTPIKVEVIYARFMSN